MAGFIDDVVVGTNVNFAGGTTADVTANGQLLIGSAVSPFLQAGTLTAGSGVSITNAANSITLAAGSNVATTYAGNTGTATPAANVLTVVGGTGASTAMSGSTVTVNVASGGYTWVLVTGVSDDIAVQTGFQTTNVAMTTLTLPATMPLHTSFRVLCMGSGLVTIAQRAGQAIRLGSSVSTTGVGGSLVATAVGDSLEIKCTTANTAFAVLDAVGNWTVN